MQGQTTQIVDRATAEANDGKKVLVLVTSRMQAEALKAVLPKEVELATKQPPGKRFDVVLDDR